MEKIGTLNKKNVVIVTSSTNYEPRAEQIGAFFEKSGCQVIWVESDFFHRDKHKGRIENERHYYIDTIPYKKNMSLRRLYSQYDFSQKAFELLKNQSIDLLYVMIPANSLVPVAAKIKGTHGIKLVYDIIDLWPESLPIKNINWLWPIKYWKHLRDNFIKAADLVITECDLYQQILGLRHENVVTLYWPKNMISHRLPLQKEDTLLHLVYLGSINNILDIDMIIGILSEVNLRKKLRLHIIGDGEKKDLFLCRLKQAQIDTKFYGIMYEEEKKIKVFSKCSFAINIMKPGICVGLTMKSVDYFCYGVPMINNIPGDTWDMIEQYGIGVNCKKGDYVNCAEQIVSVSDTIQEKRGVMQDLYRRLFTPRAFEEVLEREVLPLLEKENS